MSQEKITAITIRLPKSYYNFIKRQAQNNFRSMNTELNLVIIDYVKSKELRDKKTINLT